MLNLATLPLPGVIVYGGGGFHLGALHWLCANTRATDIARLSEWLAPRTAGKGELAASENRG